MSEDRYRCIKCGMTFKVVRHFNSAHNPASRCSEPGCGRRFRHGHAWHGQRDAARIVCTVDAADVRDFDPHTGKWP